MRSVLMASAGFAALVAAAPAVGLERVVITVEGVADEERREALAQRLRTASEVAASLDEERGDGPQDVYGLALADYRRLLGVLYADAFYGPEISIAIDGREAAEIDPLALPDAIDQIDIRVQTGPWFRFGQADLGPRPDAAVPGPVVPEFRRGRRARSTLVAEATNAGLREWREAGHPLVEVDDQQITARHPERELDVDIGLVPGPQLRFGALRIQGDREVSDRRIREIMGFPTGEIYAPEALSEAVTRVQRTGVFGTVSVIQGTQPNPDGTLDFQMTLIERPPRRFGFSADFSTDDGITLAGFWLHRNLFGGAERLRIDAEIANVSGNQTGFVDDNGADTTIGARLTRPASLGPDNDAFLFADFEDVNDPDVEETSVQFGIGLTRYFTDRLLGEVSGGLRYSLVNDAFGEREFYHAVLPSRLSWDRRDDQGDPTRGFFLGLRATPYLGLRDSQSGAQGELDLRGYYGFGANATTVLAGRVQIGTVLGSDLDETPPDFLFFSGGGGTVRGQSFQSLGIEQPNGELSGGRSFLGLSGELRQLIRGPIDAVAFYDAGYVGADSVIDTDAGFHAGAGLGVRYATPIGPVRVDIATPAAGDPDQLDSYELYIGVGQAF